MKEKSHQKTIYLFAVGLGLVFFGFFYADPYLSKVCMELSPPLRYYIKIASRALSPPFHLILWCLLYFIAKRRKNNDAFLSLSHQTFSLLWLSLPLVCGMKILLGRARPELLVDKIYGFYFMMHNHHYHSFPSGHAAVATCMLIALMDTFPKYQLAWILFFFCLSSSRVLLNYHYASDIIASGMICFLLQQFYKKYTDEKKRKSDLSNPIS